MPTGDYLYDCMWLDCYAAALKLKNKKDRHQQHYSSRDHFVNWIADFYVHNNSAQHQDRHNNGAR